MFASCKNNLLAGLAAAVAMTSAPLSADTVAHYRFEDGSDGATATQAVDSSGNGNDLTAEGSPVYSSDISQSPVPGTGDPNNLSIDFAGGQHAFSGAEDEGLNAVVFDDITIEAYVNFSDGGGWQNFIGREDSGNQTASDEPMLQFQNTDAGNFRVAWYDRSGSYIGIEAFPVEDNTWYHVAAVGDIDAGTMTLYVNGSEVGSNGGYTGMFVPDPAGSWVIGRGQWAGGASDWSNVKIDEVRFSDSPLSVGQFLNFDEAEIEIVRSPANHTAWVGEDVTFVSAANLIGDGELSYQWQISEDGGETWQDISGATSPSHTIADVGLDADRTHYRAEISFEGMSETTGSAYLRVGEGPAPAQEGVLAHYRFEEGSDGGTATGAVDSSGNGYDMEVLGEPLYSSEVARNAVGQTGDANDLSVDVAGGNHAFQGVDDEGLSNEPIDDFTVESYVNFSETGGWQTFVGRDDTDNQTNDSHAIFYFQNRGDGNAFGVSYVDRNGNVVAPGLVGPVIQPNTWYHVAAVADISEETIILYVNGVEVDRNENFPGLFVPEGPTTNWSIGRGQWAGGNSDWVQGRIDEVRISNRPLSPIEFLNFSNAALNYVFHPGDVTAAVGDTVAFSALAGGGGTDPVTYQWQISTDEGGTWTDISGATESSYTLESVALDDEGNQYRVVASRGDDSEPSESATLTVSGFPDPEVVEGLEVNPLRFVGDSYAFNVEATGVGNITYQWQKDGEDLAGETGNTLDLGELELADQGEYSVVITDDAATQEGLDPTTVTLSSVLTAVQRPEEAISLNFVGPTDNAGWTFEIGTLAPNDVAGVVPVANWNNSSEVQLPRLATQETPVPLVNDLGESTTAEATWSANNTWGARTSGGPLAEKDANNRIYHGYIESRDADVDPATVTINGIPFDTYDVYVYPMGVEGAVDGNFVRSVTLEDAEGVRQFFGRNLSGNPTLEDIPFVLGFATSIEEAQESAAPTVFRFENATGSTITLQHFDEIEWNLGGFAGISIVDTSSGVTPRPMLTSRPMDRFNPSGDNVSFSVSAESVAGGNLSYQWQKDGTDISGATGSTLTLDEVTSADTGTYTVVVTDSAGSTNQASATLAAVDQTRPLLISADMNMGIHQHMSGNAILREDGTVVEADPNNGLDDIGDGDTVWTRLSEWRLGLNTFSSFVDHEGLGLPGMSLTIEGPATAQNVPEGGGIDTPVEDWSGPLLRDYIFTESADSMSFTVSGLTQFAGREITLVVYAHGPQSTNWEGERDDIATVTLAAQNSMSGSEESVVTNAFEGRDLRFNNEAFAVFEGEIPANGTISWTISEAPGVEGLNAFNGFQLLLTAEGEAIEPEGIADWRQTHFGTTGNEGDAANDADPDGDGFKNLVEYALGTDPNVAGDGHSAVVRGRNGDFLTLTFDHIADANLSYSVEATNDLNGTWTEVQNYGSFGTSGTETFTDSESIGANPNRFLRLKITVTE